MLRSSGERVVVDGNCLSACTLVLGMIAHDHICATQRARFGFHAAWMPDSDGRPVTSPNGDAGAVEYLSTLGALLDQPARRPVAPDDLSRRPLAQRHRGELRAPAATRACAVRASALTASLLVASGAQHTRICRQRSPLAPWPRRRARRIRRKAIPTARSPPPPPSRARSTDSLARSRPARPARGARGSRARRDGSRRTTAACSNCSHGNTRAGGSSAIAAQRKAAPAAPIISSTDGWKNGGSRPDTANSTISATTPSPHSAAMVAAVEAGAAPFQRRKAVIDCVA